MIIEQKFIALPDGTIENKICFLHPAKNCTVHCAAFDLSEHGRGHLYCLGQHWRPITVHWKGERNLQEEKEAEAWAKLKEWQEKRTERLAKKTKKKGVTK